MSDESSEEDDHDQVEIKEAPVFRDSIYNKPSVLSCGSTKFSG